MENFAVNEIRSFVGILNRRKTNNLFQIEKVVGIENVLRKSIEEILLGNIGFLDAMESRDIHSFLKHVALLYSVGA